VSNWLKGEEAVYGVSDYCCHWCGCYCCCFCKEGRGRGGRPRGGGGGKGGGGEGRRTSVWGGCLLLLPLPLLQSVYGKLTGRGRE